MTTCPNAALLQNAGTAHSGKCMRATARRRPLQQGSPHHLERGREPRLAKRRAGGDAWTSPPLRPAKKLQPLGFTHPLLLPAKPLAGSAAMTRRLPPRLRKTRQLPHVAPHLPARPLRRLGASGVAAIPVRQRAGLVQHRRRSHQLLRQQRPRRALTKVQVAASVSVEAGGDSARNGNGMMSGRLRRCR